MSEMKFITFEGVDGSGKSTIIKMVSEYFEKNNIPYISTREPGGSRIAEQIRNIILSCENSDLHPNTEALLYAAARAQHFSEIIEPAIKENKVVLCDRFLDSSLVYQGIARNLGVENVLNINKFAINDILPTITIFFDVDPEIGLRRINLNKERELNRLDLEGLEFHNKVYNGYKQIINSDPNRFIIIDASQSIEKVFEDTILAIKELI